MANQGAQFSPQGAKEVQVRGPGFELGKYMPVGRASVIQAPSSPPSIAQAAGTQISPSNGPRGAQPVALAGGGAESQAAAVLSSRQMPQHPATTFFGSRNPQSQQHQVHVISVKGLGHDGREYVAEFEAFFPPGTKILGVTERVGG